MSDNQLTLQQLLNERVAEFAASDRPREMIDTGIAKLFKEIVDEAFRSYGELGKSVKEAFQAALPANVSNTFELTRYNTLITNALREQWLNSGIEGDMLRRANEALMAVVKEDAIPAVVSLRALLEAFVEENKEDAATGQWEHPEIRFKNSDYGGMHIYFDPEPEAAHRGSGLCRRGDRSDHVLENAIHISFNKESKEQDEKGHRIGRVYAAKLDDDPIGKKLAIHSQWQRLVAGLYFGCATLVVDCDEDDFSYGLYD